MFERWFGRKKKVDAQTAKTTSGSDLEVDYNTFPGIGHHIDLTGTDGFHATFSPDSTPDSMAAALNEMADRLLSNPPEQIKDNTELQKIVVVLRVNAEKLNPPSAKEADSGSSPE